MFPTFPPRSSHLPPLLATAEQTSPLHALCTRLLKEIESLKQENGEMRQKIASLDEKMHRQALQIEEISRSSRSFQQRFNEHTHNFDPATSTPHRNPRTEPPNGGWI